MITGSKLSKKHISNDDGQTPDKLFRFCNIVRYIEHEDEKLFRVIYDMCLFSGLSSKRGQGVTFLFPRGRGTNDIRTKIIKDAYSTNIKDAYDLINSCILKVFVPEITDFMTVGCIMTNCNNELKVSDSSSKTVTFNNGVKIEKDNNFKLLHLGAKYAVYNIVSGTPASGKPKMSVSTGSYEGGASAVDMAYFERKKGDGDIRGTVLKLMMFGEKEQYTGAVDKMVNSKFKSVIDSLTSYAKDHDDKWGNYSDQLPIHPWGAPFAVAWVIPQNVTRKWSTHVDNEVTPLSATIKKMEADDAFIELRNKIQTDLLSNKNINGELYQAVLDIYKAFANHGECKGADFSKFTYNVERFTQINGPTPRGVDKTPPHIALLAHHECMHYTSFVKDKLMKSDASDALKMIKTASMVFLTGHSPSLWVTDPKVFNSAVGGKYELLCMLLQFVRSPYFLYRASCVVGYQGGSYTGGRPDTISPYNNTDEVSQFVDEFVGASKF